MSPAPIFLSSMVNMLFLSAPSFSSANPFKVALLVLKCDFNYDSLYRTKCRDCVILHADHQMILLRVNDGQFVSSTADLYKDTHGKTAEVCILY